MKITKPSYRNFVKSIRRKAENLKVNFSVEDTLVYTTKDGQTKEYPYIRISSPDFSRPILVMRATIHGDEYAGAFTFLRHLRQIFNYAEAHGISLIIFPLDNPSGYEIGERYNMEMIDYRGNNGNNDFVRYRLPSGELVGEIESGVKFKRWYWASDSKCGCHLPKETRALHRALKRIPLENVKGLLDIHQDKYQVSPVTYFYGYGNSDVYAPIVRKIGKHLPVPRNAELNSPKIATQDYLDGVTKDGKVESIKTDCNGCVIHHDGSLPDLFWRLGVDHAITVETPTTASFGKCDDVNMAWILGIIRLISKNVSARTR